MGSHAFEREPEHCEHYRAAPGGLATLFGFEQGWNMPAARHRRAFPGDVAFPGVDHYVLTIRLGGAAARRSDRPAAKIAHDGALSLQRPGSGSHIASSGVVDYAHLYFKQGLLCEVADALDLGSVAEPEDFFALDDRALAHDVEAYLLRAADEDDPAEPLEMDSRAYLIATGLLRATRRLGDAEARLARTLRRADLRPAFELIESRLGEVLRLSDLAEAVGMSPFHFARLFKQEAGLTPARYLMRRRVERAAELMRASQASLAEIAFRTGFSSQSHMTRQVKAQLGVTPARLRADR